MIDNPSKKNSLSLHVQPVKETQYQSKHTRNRSETHLADVAGMNCVQTG